MNQTATLFDLRGRVAIVTGGNGGIGDDADFITGAVLNIDGGYSIL